MNGSATDSNSIAIAANNLEASLDRFKMVTAGGLMPCSSSFVNYNGYWSADYNQMAAIYAAHMIPLLTFIQNSACVTGQGSGATDSTPWNLALKNFSYYMPNFGTICIGLSGAQTCTTNPPMYFELGNEPDLPQGSNYAASWTHLYPNDFVAGATGLDIELRSGGYYHPVYNNYHILTAGVEAPFDGICGDATNQQIMQESLLAANCNGVPASFLGAAVHPYSYLTNEQESGYWRNFGQFFVNNACTNLDDMVQNWRASMNNIAGWAGLEVPLVMTEINFSSGNLCSEPAGLIYLEGAYQMDLFTWERDHFSYGSGGNYNGVLYPVRTLWFALADSGPVGCSPPSLPLGLFGLIPTNPPQYSTKTLYSPFVANYNEYNFSCPNWGLQGYPNSWNRYLSGLYVETLLYPCY